MFRKFAPVLASVAMLGVVGGVAAAQAFKPSEQPAQVVQIAPAAETVAPTVEPTTATPLPTATTVAPKPAPKPVKKAIAPAPVESVQQPVAPAPAPQKETVVSEPIPETTTPAAEPTPEPVITSGPKVKERPGQKPGNQLPETPASSN